MKQTYTTGVLAGTFSVGIIAILVGFAVAMMDNAADRSAVASPTGAIIRDLRKTVDAGDWALAEAKLSLLDQRWHQFLHGGPPPESFQSEVKGLARSTSP
jgi:hypothetical protein